jgi:hypothetical protein
VLGDGSGVLLAGEVTGMLLLTVAVGVSVTSGEVADVEGVTEGEGLDGDGEAVTLGAGDGGVTGPPNVVPLPLWPCTIADTGFPAAASATVMTPAAAANAATAVTAPRMSLRRCQPLTFRCSLVPPAVSASAITAERTDPSAAPAIVPAAPSSDPAKARPMADPAPAMRRTSLGGVPLLNRLQERRWPGR